MEFNLFSSRSNSPVLVTDDINKVFAKLHTYKRPSILVRLIDNDKSYNLAYINTNKMTINERLTLKYLDIDAYTFFKRICNYSCMISSSNAFGERNVYYKRTAGKTVRGEI